MCRHTEQNSQRQVDTYAGSVDTVRRKLIDRSTHMPDVSTQSEETLKTGRHIFIMCRRNLTDVLNTDRHISCVSTQSAVKFQVGRFT